LDSGPGAPLPEGPGAVSRATTRPGRPLRGACDAPGDKSITQRAILRGALAARETRIVGANAGADALAALGIVRALGIKASASKPGDWRIRGGELRESDRVLDARNSGTALRLSMGLLSAQPFLSILTGDSSLRNRPVARVIEPLRALSADLAAAALVPGSDLTVRDVGVNPTRRAFLDLLARAGARIELGNERLFGEEPVADVRIRPGALAAFRISGPEAGPLIDELPLVAVL